MQSAESHLEGIFSIFSLCIDGWAAKAVLARALKSRRRRLSR